MMTRDDEFEHVVRYQTLVEQADDVETRIPAEVAVAAWNPDGVGSLQIGQFLSPRTDATAADGAKLAWQRLCSFG